MNIFKSLDNVEINAHFFVCVRKFFILIQMDFADENAFDDIKSCFKLFLRIHWFTSRA